MAHLKSLSKSGCALFIIEGEIEEIMAELEESRRKLVNLKMQKDAAARMHTPASSAVNGSLTPEKPTERSKGLRELKDSIEETKVHINRHFLRESVVHVCMLCCKH